jgi:hypothetical protein
VAAFSRPRARAARVPPPDHWPTRTAPCLTVISPTCGAPRRTLPAAEPHTPRYDDGGRCRAEPWPWWSVSGSSHSWTSRSRAFTIRGAGSGTLFLEADKAIRRVRVRVLLSEDGLGPRPGIGDTTRAVLQQSGREDLNLRPPGPQPASCSRLRRLVGRVGSTKPNPFALIGADSRWFVCVEGRPRDASDSYLRSRPIPGSGHP